jgi:hypothetical protein
VLWGMETRTVPAAFSWSRELVILTGTIVVGGIGWDVVNGEEQVA